VIPSTNQCEKGFRHTGVFVLPATINGGTKSYFIVDSGAANVQIPEVAEEMKRNGTIGDADSLGQRRFILADGSELQHRVFRIKTLQIGDRTMENVLTAVGAPRSRALLGQLLVATELVEDRQREKRDGTRAHRIFVGNVLVEHGRTL
jgi:predicted aspartyl protease